jgi:hypothetical protein
VAVISGMRKESQEAVKPKEKEVVVKFIYLMEVREGD